MSSIIKKQIISTGTFDIESLYNNDGFGFSQFGHVAVSPTVQVESHFGSSFFGPNGIVMNEEVVVAILSEKRNNSALSEINNVNNSRAVVKDNVSIIGTVDSGKANANRNEHIDTSGINVKSKRNLIFQ